MRDIALLLESIGNLLTFDIRKVRDTIAFGPLVVAIVALQKERDEYAEETLRLESEIRDRIVVVQPVTPQPTGAHPEDYCQRCHHRMRFNYAADPAIWNLVIGCESEADWSILCIDCFIELCQAMKVEPEFTAFHIPESKYHLEFKPTGDK